MRYQLKDMPLSTALLVVVTLFVLAGSVHHVAYTFSTLEGGNLIWGYVQALGIDLGILGLAYGIQLRKRQGRSTLPLWGVLTLVTFISAYANYLYGVVHQQPLQVSSAFDQMVVFLRPFLLSVTLPIIMFALIEIIGEDRNYALKLQAQQEQPSSAEHPPAELAFPTPEPSSAYAVARVAERPTSNPSKESMMEQLLWLLYENPSLSRAKLAERLGCSRQTVYAYLQELEARGYIRRTSTGYETVVTPLPRTSRNGVRNFTSSRE
ncbi:MAG: winged helix-turn-helix domain-containing protein [Armatimonadota bacterium]|nr:winged helix-turn-helix domain-containing protein [Armatimonadota bacterium]